MRNNPASSPARMPRRRARRLAAAAVVGTVAFSGLAAAPVASSAPPEPTADCPLAFPVAGITPDLPVTGRTVVSGTDPTGFEGTVIDTLENGIAPGLDMVIVELDSAEISRVDGIWQGMSGSPVYAPDGRLIGAVAYGLAWGASPVAGVTPAEEMYRLLSEAPSDPAAAATLERASSDQTVELSAELRRRVVASGTATRAEAESGMTRLPLPLGVSGLAGNRLAAFEKALDMPGVRLYKSASASTADEVIPVVAGGNLAASISYGDVSAIGVGTATAVCGEEVLAFGHPMSYTGPSQLTMHGARALYVQRETLGAPFKVANAGAPVGSIDQDRLAGIFGIQNPAAVPATTGITSYVTVPGEWSRTGSTRISVPDAVPDIASFHLVADQDRVFDGIAGGQARVGWIITGTRSDGSTFRLGRIDRWTSKYDVSYEPMWDLYSQLSQIHFNELEDVTIDRIRTSSTMTRDYAAYKVARVRVLERGRWRPLSPERPLILRAGTTRRFQVLLTSAQLPAVWKRVAVEVPARIGRKQGMLDFLGGNSYYGEEEFYEEEGFSPESGPASFDELLRQLQFAPHNDQVLANLTLFKRDGSTFERSWRTQADAVVNEGMSVPVIGWP